MTGDNGDDEGGYGKPPKGGQFKKGQSGNPKGRKPKPKYADPVDQLFAQKFPMTINGKMTRAGPAEAVAAQVIAGAMAGDNQKVKLLYALADKSPVFKALLEKNQARPVIKMPSVKFQILNAVMLNNLDVTYENEHGVVCIKTWALDHALARLNRKTISQNEFRTIECNCEHPQQLRDLLAKYGIDITPLPSSESKG